MTIRHRQLILIAIALFLTIFLGLFAANLDAAKDEKPPREVVPMAAWMAQHPADWLTAAEISDTALDSPLPRRVELWRASFALAHHLAPRLRNPSAAFVRGGLFHWYELNAADRKSVLDTAAPLLRDPRLFDDLRQPLFELTHDFDYLRRNAPRTLGALDSLRTTAAAQGLFSEYRDMRLAMATERLALFERTRASMPPHELPSLLPRRITTDDEPLVRRILQELLQQSFEPTRFGEPTATMIEYAVEHRLQPLEGLSPFIEAANVIPVVTRARLALALDRADAASLLELASARPGAAEWVPYHIERARYEARHGNAGAADVQLRRAIVNGLDPLVLATAAECAAILHRDAEAAQFRKQLAAMSHAPREWDSRCGKNELCESASTLLYSTGPLEIDASVGQSDQIPPYVEIYADDARVAEGEVENSRRFSVQLRPGMHRVEVRLVNPRIANGSQRRVRLS